MGLLMPLLPQLPLPTELRLALAPSMASKTLSLIVRGAAGIGGGHSFGLEAHWSEEKGEEGSDKRKSVQGDNSER